MTIKFKDVKANRTQKISFQIPAHKFTYCDVKSLPYILNHISYSFMLHQYETPNNNLGRIYKLGFYFMLAR